jgi:hypothetical protein
LFGKPLGDPRMPPVQGAEYALAESLVSPHYYAVVLDHELRKGTTFRATLNELAGHC